MRFEKVASIFQKIEWQVGTLGDVNSVKYGEFSGARLADLSHPDCAEIFRFHTIWKLNDRGSAHSE